LYRHSVVSQRLMEPEGSLPRSQKRGYFVGRVYVACVVCMPIVFVYCIVLVLLPSGKPPFTIRNNSHIFLLHPVDTCNLAPGVHVYAVTRHVLSSDLIKVFLRDPTK
jgi:hypothetical protein